MRPTSGGGEKRQRELVATARRGRESVGIELLQASLIASDHRGQLAGHQQPQLVHAVDCVHGLDERQRAK
jgi:hypothetical protein